MANTTATAGLTPQSWDDKFFKEYINAMRFYSVMGNSENNIIQTKSDLTKKRGDSVTFALVNRLKGSGVTGSATLKGNEEQLFSRSFRLAVDQVRNAVVVPELEEQFSAIGLRDAAKQALKVWIMERTRDDIIKALASINGVCYSSAFSTVSGEAIATEQQKDTWLTRNADRVLFGNAVGNNQGNDHSASLGAITSSMKLGPEEVSLMKRMAKTASPKIRPVEATEQRQSYILYCGSLAFRDFANNATVTQANRDALARGKNNPIFSAGDLMWDNVIIKEIEDIPSLGTVGASGAVVAPVFFCGAQALGMAWAKRSQTVTDEDDYKDKKGVAVREIRGIEKMTFGSGATDTDDLKDNGIVTGYFAAAPDA
jgi:N4-gp56 family major capsid protein